MNKYSFFLAVALKLTKNLTLRLKTKNLIHIALAMNWIHFGLRTTYESNSNHISVSAQTFKKIRSK